MCVFGSCMRLLNHSGVVPEPVSDVRPVSHFPDAVSFPSRSCQAFLPLSGRCHPIHRLQNNGNVVQIPERQWTAIGSNPLVLPQQGAYGFDIAAVELPVGMSRYELIEFICKPDHRDNCLALGPVGPHQALACENRTLPVPPSDINTSPQEEAGAHALALRESHS